jgi:hypothetical protein
MSFKDFITQHMSAIFRDPEDTFGKKVSDEELSDLENGVEHELIREHLRSISGPYEFEANWSVNIQKFQALKNQSILQYHSTFHRSLWKYLSEMSLSERRVVSDYLEALAGNLSHGGQWLGEHQIRELARHVKESEINTGLLGEPWMSPIKVRRSDLRGLFEQLGDQARLIADDLELDITSNIDQGSDDRNEHDEFESLRCELEKASLLRFDTRLISLVRNMDYVLACYGDWKACKRMATHVVDIAINSPFLDRPHSLNDERVNKAFMDGEILYISRAWLELSEIEYAYAMPTEKTAGFTLRDKTIDLRMPGVVRPSDVADFGVKFKEICRQGVSFKDLSGSYQEGWEGDVFGYMKKSLTQETSSSDKDAASNEKIVQAVSRLDEMARVFFHRERELEEQRRDQRDYQVNDIGERALDYFHQYIKRWGLRDPREIALVETLLKIISKYTDADQQFNVEIREQVRKLCKLVEETPKDWRISTDFEEEPACLVVLDGIGPSETKEENNPEKVYRELLSPLPLAPCTMGADEVFYMLQAEFPWMTEVNKAVAMACAKANHYRTGFWRMRPTLLAGPAGSGKTRWIRRISEILGVQQHSISMSGIVHSKGVIGSERGWLSARPSFPALGFLKTKIANPILYIDELDKLSDPDVADSFLPMLEKETAARYPDIYLLGNMNLSASTFLFSANDLGKISPILLSRLNVVHVRRPVVAEAERVLQTMFLESVGMDKISMEEANEGVSEIRSDALRVFNETGDLRAVQRLIEDKIEENIWKPPGPRIVS